MERRLGVQQLIPREALVHWRHDPKELEAHIKQQMMHQLGVELMKNLWENNETVQDGTFFSQNAQRGQPVTVRLLWTESQDVPSYHTRVQLIADLVPVQRMQNYMIELPPFEFISRVQERAIVEWQCAYCGQVNLVVEHLQCRKCGAPRKVLR